MWLVNRSMGLRGVIDSGRRVPHQRGSVTMEHMHYLSFLAVQASTRDEAFAEVASFLEHLEGSAYDWYVIGGRWSGACGGEDYVCAGENRSVFDAVVARGVKARDEHFNQMRQYLAGPDERVVVGDGFEFAMGERDSAEHDAWVQRVWNGYRESAKELHSVLQMTTSPAGRDHEMLGYHLEQLGKHLLGQYDSRSYFYDTVSFSPDTEALHERVSTDPMRQWVVVVDLHR